MKIPERAFRFYKSRCSSRQVERSPSSAFLLRFKIKTDSAVRQFVPLGFQAVGRVFVLVLVVLILGAPWQSATLNAQPLGCDGGQLIDQSLTSGSRWELCWSLAGAEGILLHQVHFTPPGGIRRQILKEAGLAQIYTHYDDGKHVYHYLAEPGLGGSSLLQLTNDDCVEGQRLHEDGQHILCRQVVPRGYVYRHFSQQRQGEYLRLFSASDVGGPVFIVEWRFYDDGTIEPLVGDTGRLIHTSSDSASGRPLDADSRYGIGYINNVYWRLDFDLGTVGTNDIVEEMELLPADNNTQRVLSLTPIESETARSVLPEQKRSWRVRSSTLTNGDGRSISFQIEPRNLGHQYVGGVAEPWTQNQLYVTVHRDCERLVSLNPQADSCGSDITQYVDGESLEGADVVLWYGASSHRLIQDEDEPVKPIRWLSFQIVPRDWTAQNPLIQ